MKFNQVEIFEDAHAYLKIRKVNGPRETGRNKSLQFTKGEAVFLRNILCHFYGIPRADQIKNTVDGKEEKLLLELDSFLEL